MSEHPDPGDLYDPSKTHSVFDECLTDDKDPTTSSFARVGFNFDEDPINVSEVIDTCMEFYLRVAKRRKPSPYLEAKQNGQEQAAVPLPGFEHLVEGHVG